MSQCDKITSNERKATIMHRPYKRLSTGSEDDLSTASNTGSSSNNNLNDANTNSEITSNESKTRVDRLSEKIYALLWVSAAISLGYYLDLPYTLLADQRIHRTPFNVATILLMINLVLLLYLGVYLPKIVGINDSSAWDAYCPRVIPIMTINGILCAFLGIRSLWPVWGFLTPLILGIEFFGCLFLMHFVPWM